MGSSNVMTFRGKYAFLSNMYAADFEWDGRIYHSSEAAFQSAKSLDPAERDRFSSMNGVTAKRAGRQVRLRGDWESVKDDVMEEVVRAKFLQNPELAKLLIETEDLELVEGNRWHDTYWGVDLMTGKGENHLGIILMKIRAELGGADYQAHIEKKRAGDALQAQQKRDEILNSIAQVQAQLDALPAVNFVGETFGTKAFGPVTILRHEGNYLYFEVRGAEKKFALPGCILQGFLTPDDPETVRIYREQQSLLTSLKTMQDELQKLR